MDGHDHPGPAHHKLVVVDLTPHLHHLTQAADGHRIADSAVGDQRDSDVNPPRFHIGGVKARGRQRCQQLPLGLEPSRGRHAGDPVGHRVDAPVQPHPGALVEVGKIPGRAGDCQFGQEAFFRVGGMAARSCPCVWRLPPDRARSPSRSGEQTPGLGDAGRTACLASAQRSHPIRAPNTCHPTRGLEEAHQPLEGVFAIRDGRKPPLPPP